MRSLLFATSLILASPVLAAAPARAEEPVSIGIFGNWEAVTFKEQGKQGCYITSVPAKKEGNYTSRDKTYALVTHRPADKTFDVVTVVGGYSDKEDSVVTVKIGTQTFSLFTNKDAAWAQDDDTDKKLVQAMIKGQGMVVQGTSTRGTETTDTYSLSGFTKAYQAIGKACAVPAP